MRLRVTLATGLAALIVVAIGVAVLVASDQTDRGKFSAADISLIMDSFQSVDELETLGYRARPEVNFWPISTPLDWSADPFHDDAWQFLFHAWGMTDPYFKRYLEDGDPDDLVQAANYAADWARFHYEEGKEAPYSWFDMAAGFRAMRVAFLLDRIASGELKVDEQTAGRLRQIAIDHVRRLQDDTYIALNNHGLFQVLGLRMLCALPEMSGCTGVKKFTDRKMKEIVRDSYTKSGVHKEHSPGYALRVTRWLDQPAFLRWWSELIKPVISKAKALEPWYILPNGEIVAVGDSGGLTLPRPAIIAEPTCLGENRCMAVKDLTRAGYAIIRSTPNTAPEKSSMLFVTGAAYSLVHKHVDDLSFVLFESGRHLFIDPGMTNYTRDAARRYVLGASAHNTISLADFHIEPKHVKIGGTKLEPIKTTPNGFVVEGTVDRQTIFQQRRTIIWDPGRTLTVRDQLSGRYQRQYVSSLHLAPDLAPVLNGHGSFTVALEGSRVIRARVEETDCSVSVVRGQEDPLLGWAGGKDQLVATSVVRALCPKRTRTITWRIDLGGALY